MNPRSILLALVGLGVAGVALAAWLDAQSRQADALPAPHAASLPASLPAIPAPSDSPRTGERAEPGADRRFARYDRNKDGHIGQDEFLANRLRAFGKLDQNGDGRLDFAEYSAAAAKKFAAADSDHDNLLDPAELRTTARKQRPRANCQTENAEAPDQASAAN